MQHSASSKRILITGAAKGLGHAMLTWFASHGHIVIGCDRDAELLPALQKQFPAPHMFAQVDVADAEAVQKWAEQVLKAGPPPDILINNAGVVHRLAPMWELSAKEFSTVVEINIIGAANVVRGFVPAMIKAKKGVIVNFTSSWSHEVAPGYACYCASKFGLEGLR